MGYATSDSGDHDEWVRDFSGTCSTLGHLGPNLKVHLFSLSHSWLTRSLTSQIVAKHAVLQKLRIVLHNISVLLLYTTQIDDVIEYVKCRIMFYTLLICCSQKFKR